VATNDEESERVAGPYSFTWPDGDDFYEGLPELDKKNEPKKGQNDEDDDEESI